MLPQIAVTDIGQLTYIEAAARTFPQSPEHNNNNNDD
jgi:hypothetical protein